jgi:isochorismate synthase
LIDGAQEMKNDLNTDALNPIVNAALAAAKHENAALALWTVPKTHSTILIVSLSTLNIDDKLDHMFKLRKGFVVNPFKMTDEQNNAIFIAADGQLIESDGVYSFDWGDNVDRGAARRFGSTFQRCLAENSIERHVTSQTNLDQIENKLSFIQAVNNGIQAIQRGEFSKVVLARGTTQKLKPQLSLSRLYQTLLSMYPDTFVSMISLPEHGTWLGASPEFLLRRNKSYEATTMALAGTQHKAINAHADDISYWGEKELHEQKLVSDFVENLLKSMGVGHYTKSEKSAQKCGSLFHLKEEFLVNLDAQENSSLSMEALVRGLHPTPAICGLPKHSAMNFISEQETFNRYLYCGFLGPVNFDDELHLYVNIRCMQLLDDIAVIYAGAGITHDSDPICEWEETSAKCQMMLKALESFI